MKSDEVLFCKVKWTVLCTFLASGAENYAWTKGCLPVAHNFIIVTCDCPMAPLSTHRLWVRLCKPYFRLLWYKWLKILLFELWAIDCNNYCLFIFWS